jgi:hypothetical protein
MSEEVAAVEEQVVSNTTPQVVMPTIDLSDLERTNSDMVLRSISRNCIAVKLHIGAIGAERKMADAKVTVSGHEVAQELLSGARFKMVPPEIKNPLNRIANRARSVLQFGTPFVGGAYLIPLAKTNNGRSPAQIVFDNVKTLRQEYTDLATSLVPNWEAHVTKIREDFPFEYGSMEKWFVSGAQFVSLHRIYTYLFPLGAGLPVDFNDRLDKGMNRLLTGSGLSEEDKAVIHRLKPHLLDMVETASQDVGSLIGEDAAESWVVEAQQATSQAVAQAVKAMIQEPSEEFAKSLANVEGILARGGTIRSSTMENLKQAFNKLNGFSFMVPEDLKQRMRAAGTMINGVDIKHINTSESSSRELARHFAEIREDMTSNEAHSAMYGQFMRSLDI